MFRVTEVELLPGLQCHFSSSTKKEDREARHHVTTVAEKEEKSLARAEKQLGFVFSAVAVT